MTSESEKAAAARPAAALDLLDLLDLETLEVLTEGCRSGGTIWFLSALLSSPSIHAGSLSSSPSSD